MFFGAIFVGSGFGVGVHDPGFLLVYLGEMLGGLIFLAGVILGAFSLLLSKNHI